MADGACPHPAAGVFVNASQRSRFDPADPLRLVVCCERSDCQARAAMMVREVSGEAAVWAPD